MSRREWLGAAVVTSYWLTAVVLHLDVALWLVHRRETDLLDSWRLADFLPHAAMLLAILVVIWLIWRSAGGRHRLATAMLWVFWLVMIAAIDRVLLFSFPEYLHYPQYALLAFLIAWFVDPDRIRYPLAKILLTITLLGIADEALQYTWVTASYSQYLDFNDFLLNLVGGMAGLLLYYGFPAIPGRRRTCQLDPQVFRYASLIWLTTGAIMLALIGLLNITDDSHSLALIERTPSYGLWLTSQRGEHYYVLPPVTGTLILIVAGWLASIIPRPCA